ncbi:transcriptional regulator, TetR family [Pseudonocardia thermophila]|uniref:Transcriptional regulator, TetR family n=1 Tax=Pseudonocardia thermophila TaxID=1848 RepID=A0A1M7A7A7_PSETH|nr:TetR/AcrR family transcriptional regulator [Pseudonocardia thermophila]SHL38600.1 transcriptional regulator, TetR family [Pseudonocardia thermophila]
MGERGAEASARERILAAAEELFAEHGFEATPISRIADRAGVPKGLVHYYFARKPDLLEALVDRLPDEKVPLETVVVPGQVGESLRRLVDVLDANADSSAVLSHLLWREADTHPAVLAALQARFERFVAVIREVMMAALPNCRADVEGAARLLASALSYRHSMARHPGDDPAIDRELKFVARGLELSFESG